MKTPSRALLLALLTAAAALAALTLSTSAQAPGGGSESGSTETAQGRIIARVQDTTGEDGVDNYRVEFGFFPEWAMAGAESWSDAIAPRSSWLPSSRFLTKSAIDARAAADNRAWLRSSLVSVPAQSPQSPGGDSAQITGRVIARYNPDSEGGLRVEFGFVPEWAFTDTSTTEQAVERLGASNLPSARYLRVATIDASRGVWLRSSAIDVPFRAPVVVIETVQPPAIDSITCTPSSPTVDESVTCTATLSGDAPDSWAWSGGASAGSGATYSTSFSTSGSKTISLAATNTAGSDTGSTTLTVVDPVQPPAIDSLNCTPSSPTVDESITCTANLSGDAPDSWAWSGGGGSGDGDSYTISLSKAGDYTISLTVTNAAGSDSDSTALTAYDELQPPVIDAINCTPELPIVNHGVYCTPSLSGGAPDTYDWGYGVGPVPWQPTLSISFGKLGEQSVSLTVANAAGSDTHSITITVGGRLAPVIDGISCSPASPTVDDPVECTASLSGGDPVSWSWSGGVESGSGAAYNTSFSSAGSKTVSLTVTNAGGSATDSISLTAFDQVQAPVIDSVSCSPSSPAAPVVDESVTCTADLSGGAPESWAWSGGISAGAGATYTTSFGKAGDYTVSLAVANAAGRDTSAFALTVVATLQPPVVDSITCTPSDPPVNDPVKCTANLSGGATSSYAWSGGRTAGAAAIYDTDFGDAGSATVSLTVTNAAGSSAGSTSVAVNGYPQCSWSGTRQFTVGQFWSGAADAFGDGIVTCTDLDMLTYTLSSSDSSVLRVSENMGVWTVEAVGPGTAYVHITVADPGDLSYTVDLFVTVAAGVQAPLIDRISCSPESPAIHDAVKCTATISGGDPTSYSWSGGASNGGGSTYNTSFSSAGAKTVSLTVANAAGSDTASATVAVDREAMFIDREPLIDRINCFPSSPAVNEQVTCTANLNDNGGEPASYDWRVAGATGSGDSYSTSFSKAGDYAVSLTVANAVGSDTESITLTVFDSVQPPVIDGISCSPSSPVVDEDVTCTPSLSGGAPDSYAWRVASSRGDGNSYSTSFSKAGDYTVSLTVTNAAGSNSSSVGLTVKEPEPLTINSITCDPSSPAIGESVTCTASVTDGGGSGSMHGYSWSGGTSDSDDIIYMTSFELEGDATVSLTVADAVGSDTKSTTLTVAPLQPPVIDSITCTPSSVAVGDSVTCTANLSSSPPASYSWSGGASNGSSRTYNTSFSSAGAKTVSLTVANAAGSDSDSTPLTVGSSAANRPPICNGGSASMSRGDARTFDWCSDPDGDTLTYTLSSSDPSVVSVSESNGVWTRRAVADGSARLSFTATDPGGLSDGASIEVLVFDSPSIVSIDCTPSQPVVNETVTCTAELSGTTPDSYHWRGGVSNGRGTTYTTSYSKAGNRLLSLSVSYRGVGSMVETAITVREGALTAPVIDGITCSPAAPTVGDTVTCSAALSGGAPTSWSWSGGSSGTGKTHAASFSSAGAKTVSLTVSNSAGSDTESITVTVEDSVQLPVIDAINCSPSAAEVNERVACTATLSGGAPDSYTWSGGISDGADETYSTRFDSAGTATVSLTVTNSAGSVNQSTTVAVSQRLQAPAIDSISCSAQSPGVGHSVTCTANLSGGAPASYSWSGGASNGSDATYSTSFAAAGTATVSLTVTNAAGSDDESTSLTVIEDLKPPVIDAINCTPALPTVNGGVTCTPSLSGGTPASYTWSYGVSEPTFSFSSAKTGDLTILLTVANAAGSDSRSITVTIGGRLAPVIDGISCSPASPTVDDPVECTASLSGGDPVSWSWSGGVESGSGAAYNTSFSSAGAKAVSLTVTNAAGSATDSISLTAFDGVQAPVIDSVSCTPSSPSAPVVNETVTCTATLSGGAPASYSWSGGASTGAGATYTTSFSAAGGATVSLAVTNAAGSDTGSFALTVVAALQAPVVDSITCTPSDPPVGDPVKCTAGLSGGTPSSYAWSGGRAASTAAIYNTDFGEVGAATVSLTVTNAAGSGTGSTTVTANGFPQCSRNGTRQFSVGESWSGDAEAFGAGIVTCTDADTLTYTLSSSDSAILGVSESDGTWTVEALAAGTAYVHITVTDPGDLSYTVDLYVTVVAAVLAPVIDSISCTPSSPSVNQSVTCTASLSGGPPDSYSWSGGSSSGSSASYSTSFSSPGAKTVSLTVTNSAGSDSTDVAVGRTAQRPECSGSHPDFPGLTSFTGHPRTEHGYSGTPVTVTCTDPDGDSSALVLVATSSDTGVATVSGSDGSYNIWEGWNTGTATITVTATDVDGLTGSTSFTMTITDRP